MKKKSWHWQVLKRLNAQRIELQPWMNSQHALTRCLHAAAWWLVRAGVVNHRHMPCAMCSQVSHFHVPQDDPHLNVFPSQNPANSSPFHFPRVQRQRSQRRGLHFHTSHMSKSVECAFLTADREYPWVASRQLCSVPSRQLSPARAIAQLSPVMLSPRRGDGCSPALTRPACKPACAGVRTGGLCHHGGPQWRH